MKITFTQKLNQSADFLIRRCGYGLVRDPRATEISYSRRLGGNIYPRFHMYINSEDPLILNLHIDQKQASYQGSAAHSGDYDSEYVKREAQRIYNQIILESQAIIAKNEKPTSVKASEGKGFWSSLFGG